MRTIVALYDEPAAARDAYDALLGAGLQEERLHLESRGAQTEAVSAGEEKRPGFFQRLFGFGVEKEHADVYAEGVRRGRALLSVECGDDEASMVEATLERFEPVDVDRRAQAWRSEGWQAYDESAPAFGAEDIERDRQRTLEAEQRIPVVEEQLRVGKERVSTGHVRVRSYMQETPVSQDVELRQERVTVERRPATGDLSAGERAFEDKSIEVETFGEEPIIQKEAHIVEEVVVKKDVDIQSERVEDTVKKTVVDVEDETRRSPSGR